VQNVAPNYGKWGMSRREFLKNYRQDEYHQLQAEGNLIPHLNELDERAGKMFERIMEQLGKSILPPSDDYMERVQWQNRLRAIADEQIFSDIISELPLYAFFTLIIA